MLLIVAGCSQPSTETPLSPPETSKTVSVKFPDLPELDDTVYKNIRQTCAERWNLKNMKIDTFKVRSDRDEFVIECDETAEGTLYRCVIRATSEGKWINDGRSKKNP